MHTGKNPYLFDWAMSTSPSQIISAKSNCTDYAGSPIKKGWEGNGTSRESIWVGLLEEDRSVVPEALLLFVVRHTSETIINQQSLIRIMRL